MRITTWARSPLGQWLALAGVAVPLVVWGLYLALGDLAAGDTGRMQGVINSVFSSPNMQQWGRDFSVALGAHFRGFTRVELITYYGVGILCGFMLQGVLARGIRSYQYKFLAHEGVVERRGMWLCMPMGVAVWIVGALVAYGILGWRMAGGMPLWLVLALGGAGLGWWVMWSWMPELLEGSRVRVPLKFMVLRMPVGGLVVLGLGVMLAVLGLVFWGWKPVGVMVPWWVLVALLLGVVMVPVWVIKPRWVVRRVYVPGFRRRVEFGRIKRMEVQANAEGGTVLVMTFRDDWTWTISGGSPRRLQRVGGAVGRVVGMRRRDLVTWG